MFCQHVYLCITYVLCITCGLGTSEGQKRTLDLLELKLQEVANHYVGAGNWILVLWKSHQCSSDHAIFRWLLNLLFRASFVLFFNNFWTMEGAQCRISFFLILYSMNNLLLVTWHPKNYLRVPWWENRETCIEEHKNLNMKGDFLGGRAWQMLSAPT